MALAARISLRPSGRLLPLDTSRRAQLRKFELIALGGGEGGVGGRPERPPFTAGDADLLFVSDMLKWVAPY